MGWLSPLYLQCNGHTHSNRKDGSNVHLVGHCFPDPLLQTLLAVKGLVADIDIILQSEGEFTVAEGVTIT